MIELQNHFGQLNRQINLLNNVTEEEENCYLYMDSDDAEIE